MSKPIILHISSGLQVGGAERLLVGLLAEFSQLPQNQFEHRVVYFRAGPYLVELEKIGVHTHCVAGWLHSYDLVGLWRLAKLVWQIRPKYLHSQLWMANLYTRLVGKALGVPVICSLHANYNRGSVNSDQRFKLWLDQLTIAWAAKIVAVSPEIAQKVRQDFRRIDPAQIVQISNGISLCDRGTADGGLQRVFKIGHVGRFVPVKNQALLIRALSELRELGYEFRAILVGYGPLESELRELVQKLDLSQLVSFEYTTSVEQIYQQLDCFVLPSYQEGLSIALLEAMSYGLPVIVTAVQFHPVVQHGRNGLICPPNDVTALAAALGLLINDNQLRVTLGRAAQQTVQEHYSLTKVAEKYLKLYD